MIITKGNCTCHLSIRWTYLNKIRNEFDVSRKVHMIHKRYRVQGLVPIPRAIQPSASTNYTGSSNLWIWFKPAKNKWYNMLFRLRRMVHDQRNPRLGIMSMQISSSSSAASVSAARQTPGLSSASPSSASSSYMPPSHYTQHHQQFSHCHICPFVLGPRALEPFVHKLGILLRFTVWLSALYDDYHTWAVRKSLVFEKINVFNTHD